MQLTAEISMYPFNEDFLEPIQRYINILHQFPELKVQTFPTATIVQGEYDRVMSAVRDSIKWSFEEFGKAVFVTKFIPGYTALD